MEKEVNPIINGNSGNLKTSFDERIFFNFANKNLDKLQDLKSDIIGANMPILVQNYFSKVLFFTLGSIFLAFILAVVFIVFFKSILISIAIFFFLPLTTFIIFYAYPSLNGSSLEKQMEEELPFATIYMAAVASSDLEPTKMFRLIAGSDEYPAFGSEMKKVVNQIDLYVYNTATALSNISRSTKSKNVSELFSGMAINITSGGSLKNFLEKKSENLIMDYKLDRQKYNSVAETFMDIYISLLIAAPLLLMIIFVVMTMTGFEIGMGIAMLNFTIISLVVLLNILFLSILQIKQPKN